MCSPDSLSNSTLTPCCHCLNQSVLQGLLLPLCGGGDCTLREAFIVSSVLRRVSLPVPHAAAALLRISDMEFTGTNSFFIRVLLDKKYALPYRVVSQHNSSQLGEKQSQEVEKGRPSRAASGRTVVEWSRLGAGFLIKQQVLGVRDGCGNACMLAGAYGSCPEL